MSNLLLNVPNDVVPTFYLYADGLFESYIHGSFQPSLN